MSGYATLTYGMFLFTFFAFVKDTYEYLQLNRPKEMRKYTGSSLNPEGTENVPISAFFAV